MASQTVNKLKPIKINVSSLYVLLGHNYFNNFDKLLQNAWKCYDYQGYIDFIKEIEETEDIVSSTHRPDEQIKQLEKKLNLNVSSQTYNAKKSVDSSALNKNQTKILTQISQSLSTSAKEQKTKDRLKSLVTQTTNTGYGTLQESSVYKHIESHLKTTVISNQKKLVYTIPSLSDVYQEDQIYAWQLVGKIDGLTSNGDLIEIKNRTKKLFKDLRKYEEPQIMTYLYLFGKSNGYLVEQLKSKKEAQINYIPISYQEKYFDEKVLPAVYKFINYFNIFIQDRDMKRDLILGNEKKLYESFIK